MKYFIVYFLFSLVAGQNLRSPSAGSRSLSWSFPSFKTIPTSASAPPEEIVLLDSAPLSKSDSIAWDQEPALPEVTTATTEAETVSEVPTTTTEEAEKIKKNAETNTGGAEALIFQAEVVNAEDETITGSGEAVIGSETVEAVSGEAGAVTEEAETITEDIEAVTAASEAVPEEDQTVNEEAETITEGIEAVTAESEAVSEEDQTVNEEAETVTEEAPEEPVYGKVVAPSNAVAGMIVKVEGPGGRAMQVKLPEGVQAGQTFAVQFPPLKPVSAKQQPSAENISTTKEEVEEEAEGTTAVAEEEVEGTAAVVKEGVEGTAAMVNKLMKLSSDEQKSPAIVDKLLKVFSLVGELKEIFESLDLNHDNHVDATELELSGAVSAMEGIVA